MDAGTDGTVSRSVQSLKAFVSSGGRPTSYVARPGVIAVGSGKGGVGTSLSSALLAVEAARRGEQVLLVDIDQSVGSQHMMFGARESGPGLGALRGGSTRAEDLLQPIAPGLTLLPGGGVGWEGTLATAASEHRALLTRVWGLFADYSTVVIDAGSRLESVTAACAAGVERLLCVTSPDRISLAASYALFKVLRARFERLPIELMVNGSDEHDGRGIHAVVRAATQAFLGTDVRLAGIIPVDNALRDQVQRGRSVADTRMDGDAISAVGAVMQRMLSERPSRYGVQAGVYPALPG